MILANGGADTLVAKVMNMLRASLAEAKILLDQNDVKDDQYLNAWFHLAQALHYMEFTADKTQLETLIIICNELNLSDYISGIAEFKKALADTIVVFENNDSLQDSITKAYMDLLNAKNALIKDIGDDIVLIQQQVERIREQLGDGSAYRHNDAWRVMQEALFNLEALLADPTTDKVLIRQTFIKFASAYEELRLLPDESLLTPLKNFLLEVKQWDITLFTTDQIHNIQTTKENIRALLADLDHFSDAVYDDVLQQMQKLRQLADKCEESGKY